VVAGCVTLIVVLPIPTIVADGTDDDGIDTIDVLLDWCVLETVPALEEITSNEMVAERTNFW
jgi:hypothetical protein